MKAKLMTPNLFLVFYWYYSVGQRTQGFPILLMLYFSSRITKNILTNCPEFGKTFPLFDLYFRVMFRTIVWGMICYCTSATSPGCVQSKWHWGRRKVWDSEYTEKARDRVVGSTLRWGLGFCAGLTYLMDWFECLRRRWIQRWASGYAYCNLSCSCFSRVTSQLSWICQESPTATVGALSWWFCALGCLLGSQHYPYLSY